MLVLAIDLGTTNLKVGLINPEGKLVASASTELRLEKGVDGKAEHDIELLRTELKKLILKVTSEGRYRDEIKAIVLSAYQLGLIALDRELRPITNLITLLDTRARAVYPELESKLEPRKLYERTGCPPLPFYPLSKIYWLKKRLPEVFRQARYFLSSKDFLVYLFTGKLLTEPSIASATQLLNVNTIEWDDYALGLLELEPERLPKVVEPFHVELVPAEISLEYNLPENLKLVMGVYDGGSVALGIGCVSSGYAAINIGTTAMVRVIANKPIFDKDMRFQTYALMRDLWFPGSGVNNAGIALRWLRDLLGYSRYDELVELAEETGTSAGLIFLPFLTGERNPEIGQRAYGAMLGIKPHHGVGHVVRAVLEGVAMSIRLTYDVLLENQLEPKRIMVGGGAARSKLWMSVLASMLRRPVYVSDFEETGLLGASMVAYTALGVYPDLRVASEAMSPERTEVEPVSENLALYDELYAKFRASLKLLKPSFDWD